MQQLNFSSRELLQQTLANHETNDFNAQKIYEMERAIEKQMENFDIDKKEKTARVVDDLSKIVITA